MESREYVYKQGAEGEDLLADVHWRKESPQGTSTVGHPIAIITHGGGFVQGSKSIVPRTQVEELSRLGFVVVVPNYRLCPQISVWEGPVADCRDSLQWTVSSLPGVLAGEKDGVPLDASRIVTMGHSAGATLALLLASTPNITISAILDFYGGKYYNDPTWHTPTASPMFTNMPTYPDTLTSQIYCGPQLSAATPAFGTADVPARDAWLSNAYKSGQHIALVTKDGDFDRIDPAKTFSAQFPPTMFVHGTADTITPARISERAHEELKTLGVETELVRVEGADHIFDLFYQSVEDDGFQKYVSGGLKFLASKAGLL